MKEWTLEKRVEQLFKYWKDRIPCEEVASSYTWESYNHKSQALDRRDRLALEQAHRQAVDEFNSGIKELGIEGRECSCGFSGKEEKWIPNEKIKATCPKCGKGWWYGKFDLIRPSAEELNGQS